MIHYENIFISRSLPDNLKFWQACASGVVKQLREKNAPESYIAEAEQWRTKINDVDDEQDEIEVYAETVLEMIALVEKYISDDETPKEVAEVYDLFSQTILTKMPNRRYSGQHEDDLQEAINRALESLASIESDVDSLKIDLEEADSLL